MQVIDVREICESDSGNDSIIWWFVVDHYPNDVFGLQRFPNMPIKQEYILQKSRIGEVGKIRVIENNLPVIKIGITNFLKENDNFKFRVLFNSRLLP